VKAKDEQASTTEGQQPMSDTNGPGEDDKTSAHGDAQPLSQELPTDVRVRLRKLDKLESKYYGNFFFDL
jgi:hypothetical protein